MGRYFFTGRAKNSLREIKRHSIDSFGREVARKYFEDLDKGFRHLASFKGSAAKREDLNVDTCLVVYPVREHYVVFAAAGSDIVILDVVLQSRDIPKYLNRYAEPFRSELAGFHALQKPRKKTAKLPKKP